MLQTHWVDGVLVVSGELDVATVEELIADASPAITDDADLVIDLVGLTFVDVAGVRALMSVADSVLRLVLRDAQPSVRRLFDLIGVAMLCPNVWLQDTGPATRPHRAPKVQPAGTPVANERASSDPLA